jgi:hypothetical protein
VSDRNNQIGYVCAYIYIDNADQSHIKLLWLSSDVALADWKNRILKESRVNRENDGYKR